MLRQRDYLSEALLNMNTDVDFLYKKSGFDKLNKAFRSQDSNRIKEAFSGMRYGATFVARSSELKSRVAKRADKINPVIIMIGIFPNGSFYSPDDNKIQVSLSKSAYDILKMTGFNLQGIQMMLGDRQMETFLKEFDAEGVKGTIAHELSHWATDSLYNRTVRNLILVQKASKVAEPRDYGGRKYPNVVQHPVELDAQIYAIKQVRREVGARAFNKMTWHDLMMSKQSLRSNILGGKTKEDYFSFMKRLIKRLNRENLLGKSMRNIPSYADMRRMANRS